MSDLIGPRGELLIVKLDMKLVVDHATGKWFLEEASEAKKKLVTTPTPCLSLLSTMSPNGSIRIFSEEVREDLRFLH